MGKIVTPKFRVEFQTNNGHWTPTSWYVHSKRSGRVGYGTPTHANLRKYVLAMEASTMPGGPNAHIGPTRILRATIIRQADNAVMAVYTGGV
jgi:hypothetical protein